MSEKNIHKYEEAELTANELDMINGGGYGELLKPTLMTYKAICTCGYQETVNSARYGKVICPQCKQLITDYKEGQGYRYREWSDGIRFDCSCCSSFRSS